MREAVLFVSDGSQLNAILAIDEYLPANIIVVGTPVLMDGGMPVSYEGDRFASSGRPAAAAKPAR